MMKTSNKFPEKIAPPLVYLVDDDDDFRRLIELWLKKQDIEVREFQNASAFLKASSQPGLVLLDINMPNISGLEVLSLLQERGENMPVIMLTASNTAEDALHSMRLGAYDYLLKPVTKEQLIARVIRGIEHFKLKKRLDYLEEEFSSNQPFHKIIGQSASMKKVFHKIKKISQSSIPTHIFGESGTGKELLARAIHQDSPRKHHGFVAINCAAIPDGLVESELFGHEKGAFTSAISTRKGCFERADQGTLFLDEVGELDLNTQAKLLRVLQEGVFSRVGGNRPISVDVRVLSATNRDLEKCVENGTFREDLYYRLAVFDIALPALRERVDDIPLLIQCFLEKYKMETSKPITGFSEKAWQLLLDHSWPGNIRELENVVRSAMVVSETSELTLDALPSRLIANKENPKRSSSDQYSQTRNTTPQPNPQNPSSAELPILIPLNKILPLAEIEKQAILRALQITNGHINQAAAQLKISRATLYRRLSSYEGVKSTS